MATVKRYQILCGKCHHHFPIFAALTHTVNVDNWIREKSENHDCKTYAEMIAKSQIKKNTNPIKASKKGK